MIKKELNNYKAGNKKTRHLIIFKWFIISWFVAIIGLSLIKLLGLNTVGTTISVFGVITANVFILIGLFNFFTGPNDYEGHNQAKQPWE